MRKNVLTLNLTMILVVSIFLIGCGGGTKQEQPTVLKLGHGLDYKYPHNSPSGYIPQDYLGKSLEKPYYMPKNIGREKIIAEYLHRLKNQVEQEGNQ